MSGVWNQFKSCTHLLFFPIIAGTQVRPEGGQEGGDRGDEGGRGVGGVADLAHHGGEDPGEQGAGSHEDRAARPALGRGEGQADHRKVSSSSLSQIKQGNYRVFQGSLEF